MAPRIPALLVCFTMAMTLTGSIDAQAPEPIHYTLRFPAPQTHYMEVEAVYPTNGRPQTELFMAVWTPGSYLVREYERHVESVTASGPDGRPRAVQKTRKNRWSIESTGAPAVTVTYRVYGREMTVRNNWIEAGFAMLNGAPTFLTLVDRALRPHEVRIELPAAWKGIATPLMPVGGHVNTFRAEDFDTLVDSPIIIGNPVVREFQVAGKQHYLVLEGDASLFDADRAAGDVRKIVEAAGTVMGRYDYPHYYFLNVVTEAGGGLEHKNSFLGMTGRFTTRTRRSYLGWLGLIAHEYFHNWNVKRLRPIELGPFDYENEVHTSVDAGRLLVSQVRRGTPAFDAGVNVDDEILAIDDVRVRLDGLPARLEQYKPGDKVSLLVARRDRVMRLDVTLGTEPGRAWRVEPVANPTETQKQHLASFLGAEGS